VSRPRLSVIVPVYRSARRLQRLLGQLSAQETSFPYEIIVMIDEPDDEVRDLVQRYSNIRFDVSWERRGKVNALNAAIGLAKGDVLVFLDNDVEVQDTGFLEKINRWMTSYDVAEIKKRVHPDSLLSRLAFYDYVSFGVASYFFEKRVKRCAGLNGAAMAFTRKALKELGGFKSCILEDMDIGFRSYFTGLPFKYIYDAEVIVYPPKSLREWVNQRMRWSVGAWIWIEEYVSHFTIAGIRHHLAETLSALFVMFPGSIFYVSMFFVGETPLVKVLLLLLSAMGGVLAPLIPVMTVLEVFTSLLPPFLYVLSALVLVHSFLTVPVARRLGFEFHPLYYFLYLFTYSPLWFSILMASFIRVFVFRKKDISGWKI
jgi:biofilm PGA synthesis N-glycosyltransferase PgaC